MKESIDNIRELLPSSRRSDDDLFGLFERTEVQVYLLKSLENDAVRELPASNQPALTLLGLLRDKVGGHARYRKSFTAPALLLELENTHQLTIHDAPGSGESAYRRAVAQAHARIEVPGTSVSGELEKLFLWPELREASRDEDKTPNFEEEDLRWRFFHRTKSFRLESFPESEPGRAVVAAGAGFGKSTLLSAIAHRVANSPWLPALVPLAKLADSGSTVVQYLRDVLNPQFDVAIAWEQRCEAGTAVLLFDGLDELSPTHRPEVLNAILTFASRYSQVPWLLTVRDAAVLSSPLGVPVLKIESLDYNNIVKFAENYEKAGASIAPMELINQLEAYPDLRLLARIPLFLVLLLATAKPGTRLPTRRSDLLETYLGILLKPAQYKELPGRPPEPPDLRGAAEYLACMALERGKVGLTEREARQAWQTAKRTPSIEEYTDCLVSRGLLRRALGWFFFAYPIVQEYLAACYLAQNRPSELVSRFARAASRPWAQTLQFALEQHPDADWIIRELLNKPDDAFHSSLRLIGRCIVNGAIVTPETKMEVGEKLGRVWDDSTSHNSSTSLAHILADGFSHPVPEVVRARLTRTMGHGDGDAEIVAAADDPALTRVALASLLAHDLKHCFHLHGWQQAADKIARDAFQFYMERVRLPRTTGEELDALASLISHLSAEPIPDDALRQAIQNTSLPVEIRLATHILRPGLLPSAGLDLMHTVLRSRTEEKLPNGWFLALRNLWRQPDAVKTWRAYVLNDALTAPVRASWLDSVLHSSAPMETRMEALRSMSSDENVDRECRDLALLLLAANGDEAAFREATKTLPRLNFNNAKSWCLILNKHPNADCARGQSSVLRALATLPEQKLGMARALAIGLTSDVELYDSSAFAYGINMARQHPATQEYVDLLLEWGQSLELEGGRRLRYEEACCILDAPGAVERFRRQLERVVAGSEWAADHDDDFAVAQAISWFTSRGEALSAELLVRVVELSNSNAGSRAVGKLAALANKQVLSKLLELHERKTGWVRTRIYEELAVLASRLGVVIDEQDGRLCVRQ